MPNALQEITVFAKIVGTGSLSAAARDLGTTCFSGTLAHELYLLASRHGLGRKDFSSVVQLLAADR